MATQQIYALLIGINEYGQAPLKGCVNDVQRITGYLQALPQNAYSVNIATLLNAEATKSNVVASVGDHLGKAAAGDIALLYFSGHGVQENAPDWLSRYEHDNKIECIVCYDQGQTDFLLADKEMRYVLSQAVQDPDVRVITMFDCCHSGDNMRAFLGGHTPRRIPRTFPERGFDQFIFAEDYTPDQLEQDLETLLPVRHDVHISACRAYQQAFEDKELHQGIFTDFLCTLLESRNSDVRYIDIRQIAKMRFSSRHDKQIPEITVRRKGNISLYDGWLGRSLDADRLALRADHINDETGWVMNAGQMHGLRDGDQVRLKHEGAEVASVSIASAEVAKSSLAVNDGAGLDPDLSYEVELLLQNSPVIRCSVVDVDKTQTSLRQRLEDFLEGRDQLGQKDVHFNVVIYSGFVYITNPGDHFRPRAEQLPVNVGEDGASIDEARLGYQLEVLGKAVGITQLRNPDTVLYRDSPLKIEMGLLDSAEVQDVTGDVLVVTPKKADGYEAKLQLMITNISADPVHVSAAVVSELGGIFTDLVFPEMSIRLQPGETYEATGNQRPYFALERYKRCYNWPDEHIEYKLIVSSHEPIELSGFAQEELDPPMLCGLRSLTGKGVRKVSEEERKPDWGTVEFTVRLRNAEQDNRALLDEPELSCDLMKPFVGKTFLTD